METYLVIFVNYDDGVVYREVQAHTREEARELVLQDNYVKRVIDVQPLIDPNKYLKYYEIKKLPAGTKIKHDSGITYEIKEIDKNPKGSQDTYVYFTDGSTLNFDTSEEGDRSEFILVEEIKIGEIAMSTLNEMMFAGNRELTESQLNEAVRNFTFETKDGETYDIPAATADDAITSFHRRFPTVQDEDVKAFYDDSDIYYDMITGEELDEQKLNELFNANISPNFSPNVSLDLSGGGAASLLGLLGESSEHGFSVGDKVYYVDDEPKVPGEIVEIFDDGTCLVVVNGDPDDQVVVSMDSIDYWDDNLGECTMTEDTIRKSNGKWTNRGDNGKEHGEFDTKAEADAQRRAMFASGYKGESKKVVKEDFVPEVNKEYIYSTIIVDPTDIGEEELVKRDGMKCTVTDRVDEDTWECKFEDGHTGFVFGDELAPTESKSLSEAITRDNYAIYRVCLDIVTDGSTPKVGPGSEFVDTLYKTFDELGYPLVNDSYSFDFEDMTEYYNEEDIEELLDESKKRVNEALDANGFAILMDEIRKHGISIADLEYAIHVLRKEQEALVGTALNDLDPRFSIMDGKYDQTPWIVVGNHKYPGRVAWLPRGGDPDTEAGYYISITGDQGSTDVVLIFVEGQDKSGHIDVGMYVEYSPYESKDAVDLANKLVNEIKPEMDPRTVEEICKKYGLMRY